jgi:hypothetical protein
MKTSQIPEIAGGEVAKDIMTYSEISPNEFRLRRVPKEQFGGVGPQGPIGPTGATGAAGPQGSTGPAGPQGAAGGGGGIAYTFSDTTTEPLAGTGVLRLSSNSFAYGDPLTLWATFTDKNGTDYTDALFDVSPGDRILLTFSAGYAIFRVDDYPSLGAGADAVFPVTCWGVSGARPNGDNVGFLPFILNNLGWFNRQNLGGVSGNNALNLQLHDFFTVTLGGNISITFDGKLDSKHAYVQITADATPRNLTWPGTWKWVGSTAPATLAANKTAILEVWIKGTTDNDVVASWRVEP